MSTDIHELFNIESRNPLKIRKWLIDRYRYKPDLVDLAIKEHAQRLMDGERFGYTKDGISILSNKIRERVEELMFMDKDQAEELFGRFKKTLPWWKRIFKRKNGD
jgi:hypothetical protein